MRWPPAAGRSQALARVNTDEANRLIDIAQQAAHLRWSVYEKMAARSAAEFPADGRRSLHERELRANDD